MDTAYRLIALASFAGNGPGHMWGAGGGWMWIWGPVMTLLWIALIAGAAWFLIRNIRPRERSSIDRAKEILAERYARGEMTSEEYRERLDQMQ